MLLFCLLFYLKVKLVISLNYLTKLIVYSRIISYNSFKSSYNIIIFKH